MVVSKDDGITGGGGVVNDRNVDGDDDNGTTTTTTTSTSTTASSSSLENGNATTATNQDATDTTSEQTSPAPTPPTTTTETTPSKEDEERALELKTSGNEALSEGHYTEATRLYSLALSYTPKSTAILCNRSLAYIKCESYGLAINDATTSININPNFAKGYYRRGTAEFALQKNKSARKDFKMVCKLKPKDRDARLKLAACEKAVREVAFAAAIQSEESVPLSDSLNPMIYGIEDSYDGPHPNGNGEVGVVSADDGDENNNKDEISNEKEMKLFEPGNLPLEFVMASIERFRNQKLIHKRYVARLLISCKKYFESLPSLMELYLPEEEESSSSSQEGEEKSSSSNDNNGDDDEKKKIIKPKFTICGDTHGQYYDVLNIFKLNGYPSPTNPYLFNGDFVDRGSFSLEVILTFLLFKCYNTNCIHLTRGNHETKNMNKIYGFEGEVKHKYNDDKIFDLFLEVFSFLPLAATLEDKIFITHGGLPTEENVTLEDIKNIKRGCEPNENGGLMSDLLWADPQPFHGKSPSKRGVGFSFGPDITQNFLTKNKLNLLIRSHEVKDEGYLIEHGGLTITVFSAPNYCDSMGNKGAFITFCDKNDMKPNFVQYEAVEHPDLKPMAYAAGMGSLFV